MTREQEVNATEMPRPAVSSTVTSGAFHGAAHSGDADLKSNEGSAPSLASLLRTASEISGRVSAILDPEQLLATVIPLLKEGFGVYYVHVYTLDHERCELRLRSGYGEPGRQMLARGHKISLDAEQSLVARAARTRAPVVVNDVAGNPGFLPNPLLPDTRSELALPMMVGDEVLGVFDVQDDEVGAFSQAIQDVLFTLSGQIATALQNARYVERLSLTQFSVDGAPAAILWIRPDGSLYSANDTACQLLGYTKQELLSLPAISRLDPDMIPSVWAVHWQKVKAELRFTIDTEYRAKTGKLVPMEVTANYLKYGDQEFNCVFAREISERKQAEKEREHFTVQLRTAAEISEQVGAILDPDQLLDAVIPLLKERFALYHAHVYLVDGDDLVLRAGYGRIGRIMVQQKHRISRHHPHSLVARAANTREPVLVNDVSADPDFLPNMLLPRTRSEVAVPITIGDQVLGVFDVQSDQLGYFTPADLDVFRTLSGQLANALYSAMLFARQTEMQENLRSAVQTVRAIFDAMTEGIIVTDMMGRITDLNEAALRLHGYDAREELQGRSAMELVTKSGWSRLAENMYQALESGQGRTEEYTMLRKDGSSFDAERSSALLWDPDGEPQGVVSITRDITERKRARREIARFQALAENAVDAIMMVDFAGQIIYANPACLRLFGDDASPSTLVRTSITALWPEEEVVKLVEQVLPAAGAGGWQGEVAQTRLDGTRFEASLTFFSVRGEKDEPISVATIVRDITDRKKAEADLQQFALQLRTAADVSTQINAILDPTALLEAVVPLVQERFDLYHLHVYTLDPGSRRLIMRVGSGNAGRIMRERGHAIALDQRPSLVAEAARSKNVVLVNDVRAAPSFMPNPLLPETRSEVAIPMLVGDEVVGVFDVQDDTIARFSESEVDVFSALAGQIAIALRNAQYFEEVQAVAERLREVDRLKSEFLANMSHELRTPLNSILGYAEVMLMGIDGELTPDMDEDVNAIFENGQQLLKLINDVLDLTKIEAGRMTLTKAPVAVLVMLEEAKSHCLGLLHKQPKPVTLSVSADDDVPVIIADPMRLSQILNNLVSNAIKFTEEGRVHLHARYDPQPDRVCIDISDTGVGISEENLAVLFERFRQVDGSSTRRAEGTGLGLAITKHLVAMHSGTLTVRSEVGRGSTFTVCLPVGVVGPERRKRAGDAEEESSV